MLLCSYTWMRLSSYLSSCAFWTHCCTHSRCMGSHHHGVCRVSEQTRNEIRHVVDLCNDHAPIRQVRTSQPQQQAQQPAQQQPTRPHAQQHQQHSHQQQRSRVPPPAPQPTLQQLQQHRQVAAAAAAAAANIRGQNQQYHSPDMQRLLAFGQQETPQQGYRITSA